jgi:hypothetical protein
MVFLLQYIINDKVKILFSENFASEPLNFREILYLKGPLPDLDTDSDLARVRRGAHRRGGGRRRVGVRRRRRRSHHRAVLTHQPLGARQGGGRRRRHLDALAVHLDADLLGLEAAHPDAGARLGVDGDGEGAGLLDVGGGGGRVDGDGVGGDGGGEDGGVAGVVGEARRRGGAERDGVGGGGGGEGEVVVEVDDLLVGVLGGDGELDGVGERRRGGRRREVERGELDGRDGEAGAVRAVEQVERAAGDGGDERQEDDDQQRPAEAAAEAASAGTPAPPLRRRRLRPVDWPLVHLRLGRRERRRRAAAARVRHCRRWVGLRGRVDAVGHWRRRGRERGAARRGLWRRWNGGGGDGGVEFLE